MWHPKKNLDPFLPVFSHFFMPYFDVFGSIFDICAMTDFPNVIVSMCLVSYNFCMIPHVWTLTFGLNLSEGDSTELSWFHPISTIYLGKSLSGPTKSATFTTEDFQQTPSAYSCRTCCHPWCSVRMGMWTTPSEPVMVTVGGLLSRSIVLHLLHLYYIK